jgi:hypothetical protein
MGLCEDYLGKISSALLLEGTDSPDTVESVSSFYINIQLTPDFYEAL